MTSTTSTTSTYSRDYLDAIETARTTHNAATALHARLLDAAGALALAHDAHIDCDTTIDAYQKTYLAYAAAKDQLAAIAINYSRALEEAAAAQSTLLQLVPAAR